MNQTTCPCCGNVQPEHFGFCTQCYFNLSVYKTTLDEKERQVLIAKHLDKTPTENSVDGKLGLTLKKDKDSIVLSDIVPGSAADRSDDAEKMLPGDCLVAIAHGEAGDFIEVRDWPLKRIARLLDGPNSSSVRLRIVRRNDPTPKIIRPFRNPIASDSTFREKLGPYHRDEKVPSKQLPPLFAWIIGLLATLLTLPFIRYNYIDQCAFEEKLSATAFFDELNSAIQVIIAIIGTRILCITLVALIRQKEESQKRPDEQNS